MRMSQREKRIAMVVGVLVALLALERMLVSPLLARRESAQERVLQTSDELELARRVFETDQLSQQRWSGMIGGTLRSNAPEAEGQALDNVREWAQQAGLSLTSLRPERGQSQHGFRRITVRATGTGTMESVARFLRLLETSDIPIRVSDMTVSSRRDAADDLSVQMGLATVYLPPDEGRERPGGLR